MTELKTFEQLVLYEHLTEDQILEMLEEAIKWIKSSDYDISDNIPLAMEYENFSPKSVRMMLMYFFNITEEDLK